MEVVDVHNGWTSRARRLLGAGIAMAALAAAGGGVGCSSEQTHVSGNAELAVIGGVPSPAERDAVIFIRVDKDSGTFSDCSGTLIAPDVVLTAKHCVAAVQRDDFQCTGSGDLVATGDAGVFGATFAPETISIYVGRERAAEPSARAKKVFAAETTQACRDDVALIVLDQGITGVAFPAVRRQRSTRVGEKVLLTGYGPDSTVEDQGRREVRDVRIADVGKDTDDIAATTPSRSFVVPGNTVCFGDSGGPAFASDTGALVGVYSRKTGDCYDRFTRNTYMLISEFPKVIEQALSYAGHDPVWEPTLDANGGSAGAPSERPETAGAAGATPSEASAGAGGTAPSKRPKSSDHDGFKCAMGPAQSSPSSGWLMLGAALGFIVARRRR
jgi:MYXO-CTERM domain-containing protein